MGLCRQERLAELETADFCQQVTELETGHYTGGSLSTEMPDRTKNNDIQADFCQQVTELETVHYTGGSLSTEMPG